MTVTWILTPWDKDESWGKRNSDTSQVFSYPLQINAVS